MNTDLAMTPDQRDAITMNWEATNKRRHALIELKLAKRLSEAEAIELNELQHLAGMKREMLSSPSLTELEEMSRQIPATNTAIQTSARPPVAEVQGSEFQDAGPKARVIVWPKQFNSRSGGFQKERQRPEGGPIPVSQMAYKRVRREFLALPENQFCAGCKARGITPVAEATEVHHKRGRKGSLLCDVRWFLPVCAECGDWVHYHQYSAAALGLIDVENWGQPGPPTAEVVR